MIALPTRATAPARATAGAPATAAPALPQQGRIATATDRILIIAPGGVAAAAAAADRRGDISPGCCETGGNDLRKRRGAVSSRLRRGRDTPGRMRHFPAFLDLAGRRALVLGAGDGASRKRAALAAAGAVVITTETFSAASLDGCAVAIGVGAPEPELRALSAAAQARGIPVNIVDRPDLSSFISPAVIDRDPLTIAISSGGTAPILARLLRSRIEAVIAPGFGRLAGFAARLRDETRRRLPQAERRRLLEQALGGPIAERFLNGDEAGATSAFRAALEAAATSEAAVLSGAARPGIVHLVGAGPGAADLLSLRALRLLGEADVVVHDRLVSAEVVDLARRDAERIYVGKARAAHSMPQPAINALLVRLAREGKVVVRLKGGDPLIFGRGGEEAEALRAGGIPFTIVPGITAALACAASAGVPLTHRDAAQAVTFVTAQRKEGRVDLDFAALLRPGLTLAIYMGLAPLAELRDQLLAQGFSPALPALLIENGGTERARTLRGTMAELAAAAPAWSRGGPALLLLGGTAGLATGPTAAGMLGASAPSPGAATDQG